MDNHWEQLTSWFEDKSNRFAIVRSFNIAAKDAYINGTIPCLLKCRISPGCMEFRHANSSLFFTGIQIKILTNSNLSDSELNKIGETVVNDSRLVRFLIAKGWDTLDIKDGGKGAKSRWELAKYTISKV